MNKVKCIKGFCVQKCDDDGFTLDNEYCVIEEETIWNVDCDTSRIIGGEVRLERKTDANTFEWVELSKEHFEENFKPIN